MLTSSTTTFQQQHQKTTMREGGGVGNSYTMPSSVGAAAAAVRGQTRQQQHHDYVNGNYSTTINVMHNKNSNGQHRELNGNLRWDKVNNAPGLRDSQNFEIPLPFGYHMDLDFLRFCSDNEMVSGETLDRLKDLRKQRRKQRKTLEALMGIRQEQYRDRERKVKDDIARKNTPPSLKQSTLLIQHMTTSRSKQPPPDVVTTPEFIKEALRDAVQDFELCLARSKDDKLVKTSTPRKGGIQNFDLLEGDAAGSKLSKFNTFPRALSSPEDNIKQQQTATYKMFRQSSNSSLSSISTSTSMGATSPDAVLAGLPSSVPSRKYLDETESITSITSEMSTHTLKSIREQMARSLGKLKEYEKQVEAIPVMQVKLSVLKEEKRLLMLKLKQRELQLRRERGEMEPPGESDALLDYDTEDEDGVLDEEEVVARRERYYFDARARSESPYARGLVNIEDFPSFRKKRSVSCGYNSDSDLMIPMTERSRFYDDEGHQHRGSLRTRLLAKSTPRHNLSSPHIERVDVYSRQQEEKELLMQLQQHQQQLHQQQQQLQQQQLRQHKSPEREKIDVREAGTNTDKLPDLPPPPPPRPPSPKVQKVRTRDRAQNTDPPPRSPPPARKVSHGTNTLNTRTVGKGVETAIKMDSLVTKEEMDARVQEAIYKTEEELMGCPLLQKAMAKVEEEALRGSIEEEEPASVRVALVDGVDFGCQVGDEEHLRPFVISVGLQCKLDDIHPIVLEKNRTESRAVNPDREKVVRTIGVGECKVIEDRAEPTKFREIGICTEKWVEVIKASKQTDTEDFAFKDTESPRVADMVFEPSPERIVLERRSSLRRASQAFGSPTNSRRSSVNSPVPARKLSAKPVTRTQGTMTLADMKVKVATRDAKTDPIPVHAKPMSLALTNKNSPAGDDEIKKLCDKCDRNISLPSPSPSPRLAPPSPDMPWLSKIPRPVPENPDVYKLKSATSTGNLSIDANRARTSSPKMPRSKSNMSPSLLRRPSYPMSGSSKSPLPTGRPLGTPPPYPATPPVGSRRAPSPLARSQSPGSSRSLIPKLSPGTQRRDPPSSLGFKRNSQMSQSFSGPLSPASSEVSRSLIPRVATPPALRKMYPQDGSDKLSTPNRNVVRKNTFTKLNVGVNNPSLDDKAKEKEKEKPESAVSKLEKMKRRFSDIKEKLSGTESESDTEEEGKKKKGFNAAGFPLPGAALFAPIDENRPKTGPSKEMRSALKVLNDSVGRSSAARGNAQVTNAVNIVQQEWFKVSSTKLSNPLDVEDYLDAIEDISKDLLDRVVNLTDVNGNTALHYSVSHGSFDVVSILLDSKVANTNILNKAGYTCTMLISLANIATNTHRSVVARLFSLGDVNLRATQHGQTAIMLAVSHGRLDMAQLLVEAGADVNIRDEDGSTALMCAAEHGHMELVKFLMGQPETNVLSKDNDGLTALAVAMEAGHRDVGVVLYANMSFSRGTSPYSSLRMKKGGSGATTPTSTRSATPTGQPPSGVGKFSRSPIMPTPPLRTRRNSNNQ
jgi:hypothetical protein